MDAAEQVGAAVIDEQAEAAGIEDHSFDTFEEAVDALEDDAPPEEQPEPEEPEEGETAEDSEVGDDVEVTMDDGDRVSLSELKKGFLRQADYTHKTTEVAQERRALEAMKAKVMEQAGGLDSALQNLSGYLQGLIPPEPPLQLARTNPGEYQYQMASRNGVIAELQNLLTMQNTVMQHREQLTEAEQQDYRNRETAALVKTMPVLSDPIRKTAFDQAVKDTAATFGFSPEEIATTVDHRVLRLVHYARLGMKAEENRKNAQRRVETPKLAKARPAVAPVNVDNRKAMHILNKTGNWRDALKVDFE